MWEPDAEDKEIIIKHGKMASILPKGALQISKDTPLMDVPSSFKKDEPEGKAKLFNAASTPCAQPTDEECVEVTAYEWAVIPEEQTDRETGEVTKYLSVCLYGNGGEILKTASEVVMHRLADALRLYSPAEWARGIKFRLVSRMSKSKRRYFNLVVVP